MAMGSRELSITVRAAVADLINPMRQAQAAVIEFGETTEATFSKIEASTEKMSRLWKSVFEAFLGFEMLEGLKKIAESANDLNDALEIAQQTAKNFGHSMNVEDIESQLVNLSKSAQGGGYALKDMAEGFQKFSAVGASPVQSMRLLTDAIGLAAARHLDLAQAIQIAQYAATGHVAMLSRYGIVTKDAAGQTLSFSQVMSNWESSVAGAAQKRAEGLEGSFGRLSTAVSLLGQKFGNGLIPFFEAAANLLTALATAFASLPQPIQDIIAGTTVLSIGLTATALLLPGLVKLVGLTREGFALLGATVETVGGIFKLFTAPIGIAISAIKDIVTWLGLMRDAFAADAVAEWAAMGPWAAIIGALVAVGVAIYELIANFGKLQDAWGRFVKYLLGTKGQLVQFFQGLLMMFNPATMGEGIALLTTVHFKEAGSQLKDALGDAGNALKQKIIDAFNFARNLLFPTFKDGKQGKIDWSGLGGPGKAGKGDQKAINDILSALKAGIENGLNQAQLNVDKAKADTAVASARLDSYKEQLDPNAPRTAQETLTLQRLIHEQLQAQGKERGAIVDQMHAEQNAAAAYLSIAKQLPANDKDRVAHLADLNKQHDDALMKAENLRATYERMGSDAAKAVREITAAWRELKKEQLDADLAKINATLTAHLNGHRINEGVNDFQRRDMRAKGQSDPVKDAMLNYADAEEKAKAILQQIDAENESWEKQKQALAGKELQQAQITHDAKMRQLQTESQLADLEKQLTNDALQHAKDVQAHKANKTITGGLFGGIPGMSVGDTGALSFSWIGFIVEAAKQSKSFGDIMQTVNQLMKLFAQIIDAFRPVIDTLLRGMIAVANGFVAVWNIIAKFLNIFGLHVQTLQYLSDQFANSATPFIRIVHDIPTLNELASGNINPLYASGVHDTIIDNLQNNLQETLNGQDLGGGILGVLTEILGGILALKLVMGLFGGGGGGGLLGGLFKNFSFGGTKGLGGLSAFFGQKILGGATGATVAGALAAVAGGALLGDLTGKLFGGGSHSTNGAIGGAIGGGLGATLGMFGLAAGPLGALAGAGLGALVGSLFGHKDNPANMPDKYDTQRYGTIIAALTGSAGANGQSFSEDPTLKNAFGGQTGISFIEETLAQYGSKDKAPDWLKPIWDQMMGMFGMSSTGGGKLNFGHAINNENITGAQGVDGKIYQYTDFGNALQTFVTALQSAGDQVSAAGGNIANGAQNITRFFDASMNDLAGSAKATPGGGVGGAVGNTLAPVVGDGGSGSRQLPGAIHFNNHFHGDIYGNDDVDDLGERLADAAQRRLRTNGWALNRSQF